MRNDIFDPKLQEHYRLQTAQQFIVILEAKLGEQVSRIVQLEDDIAQYREAASNMNMLIDNLPRLRMKPWML
jgi:cell fate (sporulation/competence/biofilm development) regulator YlbF (YheA/YmcA/DUF963 family)